MICLARTTLAAVAALAPALCGAESLASSAASSASLTASSASESLDSSRDSSRASSPRGNTAAAGEYRIQAVVDAPDQPGRVRVTLAPVEPAAERPGFDFTLPQRTFEAQQLARGDAITVRERPYGFEFARGQSKQAFFLVLADAWFRELDARPVAGAVAASL
jgi:hypothetical protein